MRFIVPHSSRWIANALVLAMSFFGCAAAPAKGVSKDMNPQFKKERSFSVKVSAVGDVSNLVWSPGGTHIAAHARLSRQVKVFDISSGREIAKAENLIGGGKIDFASENQLVLPLAQEKIATTIWNFQTGEKLFIPAPANARSGFEFFRDISFDSTRKLFVGLYDVSVGQGFRSRLVVYEGPAWKLQRTIDVGGLKPKLSPDGKKIAVIHANEIVVIERASGSVLRRIRANNKDVQQIAWSADSRNIASGTMGQGYGPLPDSPGKSGPLFDKDLLQVWDAASGERVAVAKIDVGGGVQSLAFSDNGKWLASVTSDGKCRVWDAQNLSQLEVVAENLRPGSIEVSFSPGSKRLIILRTATSEATTFQL